MNPGIKLPNASPRWSDDDLVAAPSRLSALGRGRAAPAVHCESDPSRLNAHSGTFGDGAFGHGLFYKVELYAFK